MRDVIKFVEEMANDFIAGGEVRILWFVATVLLVMIVLCIVYMVSLSKDVEALQNEVRFLMGEDLGRDFDFDI